jgi:hypothetical protein
MIIIDISIFMDMLYMKLVLAAMVAVLVVSGVSFASAAQLSWDARTADKANEPKFTFQRTINIDYSDGGVVAAELRGKHESVKFSVEGSSLAPIIEHLNKKLEQSGSSARISDLQIDYSADLVGHESDASIEYNIILIPKIEKFLIQEYSEKTLAIFDVSWRGITISEPILAEGYDITKPISILENKFPLVSKQLSESEAKELLSQSLIDSSGIEKFGIAKWHSLFDPTAIIPGAIPYGFKGEEVVTTFSMGESTIINPTREKMHEITVSLDKKYVISSFEAADSATLFVPGYARAGTLGAYEIIEAGTKPPLGTSQDDKNRFPIMVMYGMAGAAAAGAGGFFWWSNKKAKKEQALGQTGIDPSQLRGIETSAASGGYKTNRGEAQLKSETCYDQTKSVYSGDSMPKG